MAGTLTVVIGSMYSAKSTRIIEVVQRAVLARRNVAMFKHGIDDRYSSHEVVSHGGLSWPCFSVSSSSELLQKLPVSTDVVAVDESQFFDSELASVLKGLVLRGYDVVAAGLDNDFRDVPFPTMVPLVFGADEVIKLRAVCTSCGSDASCSQRLVGGIPTTEGDVIEVGGAESYEARCRGCFVRSQPAI